MLGSLIKVTLERIYFELVIVVITCLPRPFVGMQLLTTPFIALVVSLKVVWMAGFVSLATFVILHLTIKDENYIYRTNRGCLFVECASYLA